MTKKKNAVCNTCTIMLLDIAYRRSPLFMVVREPLKCAMRLLSRIYRINPAEYAVHTPACYGCVRFYKTALKEKSRVFYWLNDRINPTFNLLLEKIITAEEMKEAKSFARSATAGNIEPAEALKRTGGRKVGF